MGHNDDAISPGTVAGTVAADTEKHNKSAQEGGVHINFDPVLDPANEHHHAHLHHAKTESKVDDIVFAKSDENYPGSAAAPDYKVRAMSSSNDDEESGGVGEVRSSGQEDEDKTKGWKGWTFKRVYRQYRFVFHFVFWAVWTA